MAYETETANINVTVREIDFVSSFAKNWEGLRQILGVAKPIKKEAGAQLRKKRVTVNLQSGSVAEGAVIPFSEAFVEEIPCGEMTIEKYAKSVTAEAIKDHGYDIAVADTDEEFREQLQNGVMNKFYSFLKEGELTAVYTTFQMALSMARSKCVNKWRAMNRSASEIVGFVNIDDFYAYLGSASITEQNQFGLTYVKNFLGYNTIILCSDNQVAHGYVYATPVNNIVNYYVDPSMSDFARAGLQYTTAGDTNLIGFHTEGNYKTMTSESYAVLGIKLFADFIDGISNVKVEASGSIGAITGVSTAAGTVAAGDTVVTLPTTGIDAGAKMYWKAQASTAPAAPTYLADFDAEGWTLVKNGDTVSSTNGHKYRVVEVNGTNQVIATADGTVVAKT